MPTQIPGIHHITAIAGSPQQNVDFYARVLGLRLVKKTVNFDDPYTYHLYYGDEIGHPGSIMTFFPWPAANPGRVGTGQVSTTAFMVPESSIDYWQERLAERGVETDGPMVRFDERLIAFRDPDGLQLELITHPAAAEIEPWSGGPVPAEHAIRGFHGATLAVEAHERTADLLETMGFEPVGEEPQQRFRYRSSADIGSTIDVVCSPNMRPGYTSAGTVHHIAFRVESEEVQMERRDQLVNAGFNVTPIIDRQYFKSIYFREPAGVLFEIATDPPGFTKDEDVTDLGTELKLPSWLESRRDQIEAHLPIIPVPEPARANDD